MTIIVLGGWYVAFSMPLSAEIDEMAKKNSSQQKRLVIAKEIEKLRAQVALFKERLPEKTDPNEWVEYMIAHINTTHLKIMMLDTDGLKDVGPYKAVVIKVSVDGSFFEIDKLLRWFETNPRLMRVTSLRLTPGRLEPGVMGAQIVLLGVMG